jgi:phosphate transport system protein
MEQHTVHSYDRDLEAITGSILEMGTLLQKMLEIAEESLSPKGDDYVLLALETDKQINSLDFLIEQQATSMLALRQPVGIDLRMVTSALKAAVILERMGDLAKNTVKRTARMTLPIPDSTIANIRSMMRIISGMLSETLDAFAKTDKQKVFVVCGKDDEVDALYYELIFDVQTQMAANPDAIRSYMQVIFAVKNIERIGDYVTKLAKMVYYIVSGERAPRISEAKQARSTRVDSDDE